MVELNWTFVVEHFGNKKSSLTYIRENYAPGSVISSHAASMPSSFVACCFCVIFIAVAVVKTGQ